MRTLHSTELRYLLFASIFIVFLFRVLVVTLPVFAQMVLTIERLVTLVTHLRLLSAVNHQVPRQVLVVFERFRAERADIRPFVRVCQLVPVQVFFANVRRAANAAYPRPLLLTKQQLCLFKQPHPHSWPNRIEPFFYKWMEREVLLKDWEYKLAHLLG